MDTESVKLTFLLFALNPADFAVYPRYVNLSDPGRPTSSFIVLLDWNHTDHIFDTNAQFISGIRTVYADSSQTILNYSYAPTDVSPNNGAVDANGGLGFSLSTEQRTMINYSFQLSTGTDPTITGPFRSEIVAAPRMPAQPNLISAIVGGPDVTVMFSGTAWQDPIEFYNLYRSGLAGPPAAVIHIDGGAVAHIGDPIGGTKTYIDTPGAGTWNYFLETIGYNKEYKDFIVYSPFSDTIQVIL